MSMIAYCRSAGKINLAAEPKKIQDAQFPETRLFRNSIKLISHCTKTSDVSCRARKN